MLMCDAFQGHLKTAEVWVGVYDEGSPLLCAEQLQSKWMRCMLACLQQSVGA